MAVDLAQKAQNFTNRGRQALETGRYALAVDMLMEAVSAAPDVLETRRLLRAAQIANFRRNGKVMVNNRKYTAETTYFSDADMATARRDASGRAAEDLARQIVDDVTSCRWDNAKGKEGTK